jgi:hypothetical protein
MNGFTVVRRPAAFLKVCALLMLQAATAAALPPAPPEMSPGMTPAGAWAEPARDSMGGDSVATPALAPATPPAPAAPDLPVALPAVSVAADSLPALPPKLWQFSGTAVLTFNQSSFNNWVSGGDNQIGLITVLRPRLLFDNGRWSWFTQLDMRFGLQKVSSDRFSKSEDILRFESKLGRQISQHWSFSGIYTLNTQLAPTYNAGRERLLSSFMAPGYTNLGLGFDFRRSKVFSLYLSPINMRTTYVLNDSLAQAGEFGVSPGSRVLRRLGPAVLISYANTIWENVTLDTQLGWFQDFYDKKLLDPVINFDAIVKMQVNKILAVTAICSLFYDENSKIEVKDENGVVVDRVAKIQLKQTLGVGVSLRW